MKQTGLEMSVYAFILSCSCYLKHKRQVATKYWGEDRKWRTKLQVNDEELRVLG